MFDLNSLLRTVGYAGIFAIVFSESGLLIGFFLPGDSLLFTAGFLASQHIFNIAILCVIIFIAAVSGDSVGYWFGKKAGPRVFRKEDSLIFSKENVDRAQKFYDKHGGKTVILARFIPHVRTLAPIIAGVSRMHYPKFFTYNVVGGAIWAFGVTLLGYFLGNVIPNIDNYLIPIALLIILTSIAPGLWHLIRNQEARANYLAHAKKAWHNKRRNRKKSK